MILSSFFSHQQQTAPSFLSPSGRDCPLLQVLAGEVTGEEVEGCLPWIVSRLLEGNNYSGLLLRLDPQGDLEERVWFLGKLWDLALGLIHPNSSPGGHRERKTDLLGVQEGLRVGRMPSLGRKAKVKAILTLGRCSVAYQGILY